MAVAGAWAAVSIPTSAAYGMGKALYEKPKLIGHQEAFDAFDRKTRYTPNKMCTDLESLMPIFRERQCGYNNDAITDLSKLINTYLHGRGWNIQELLNSIKDNTEPFTPQGQGILLPPEKG